MDPSYWWWHGFGFMWIFPVLFFILMIVLLFRGPAWFRRNGSREDAPQSRRESPREILDRTYASGEITKEQYEEMRRTLER